MQAEKEILAKHFIITGLVQGVGFRPYIYQLANEYGLKGWVNNTNESVNVHVEGTANALFGFECAIDHRKPAVSKIDQIIVTEVANGKYSDFSIYQSEDISGNTTEVSPDIAVCNECIADMHENSFRHHYPLINCAHCGPRFSIVEKLPYDRSNTSMQPFKMCDKCKKEYEDPSNRRFHAQPVACNTCGPLYTLYKGNNTSALPVKYENINSIIYELQAGFKEGKVYAFKATGGYNLVCNALNEDAVARLRAIKHRDTKPFAVMFSSISTINEYLECNITEEKEMTSFRRPVVILKNKKTLAPSVSMKLTTTGAMLPSMPLHYLLFDNAGLEALVMTSANISDEPIVICDNLALTAFSTLTDGVLAYNRAIHNRLDDSVLFVANDKPRLIRRSKGYVPEPIDMTVNTEGVVAVGAELTGAFAIGKGKKAIVSQHLGDLQNFDNFQFFTESYERFRHLFRFDAKLAVCDMHPDYLTTSFAKVLNVAVYAVQHHHAHIASVIAEHKLTEPILGIAFDGTGYGVDGHIWGSEFMYCYNDYMERLTHFEYLPLPGGDKATLEPWRMAVSYLYAAYGSDFKELPLKMLYNIDSHKLTNIITAIDKGINCPLTCSAGRLFDAVAALIDICTAPTFHAEAPMRLEAAIEEDGLAYNPDYTGNQISFLPVIRQIVEDLNINTPKGNIAARFHNTIINVIVETAVKIALEKNITTVALSGGVFQNKYILEKAENKLNEKELTVLTNKYMPCNDACVAVGQLYLGSIYLNSKNK